MRDAALNTLALVWWAPSVLLGVAAALAFSWGVRHRLRRIDRLLDTGRKVEALRVYAAVERDRGAARRRGQGDAA